MTFLRKTSCLVLAVLVVGSVWAPQGRAEVPMSGIGNYSLEAIQLYPYGVAVPFDTPGSPYREMKECANATRDRLINSAHGSGLASPGMFQVIMSVAPASCVLFNPGLNAALDAQMREVAGR
ncbi:hypothetical protein [Corynebacterium sp.]|uniref:hypothetical protein n=1 Tax=Corynebacterium sp. TaxID=1720 RepID=UPI002A91F61C|nr:hypothetical protein [Corynebacterium sp.]MDY5786204.1 hypothetical protein [Corynebacterium sp.]